MASPRRRCANCGKPLEGRPNQKTCSPACRAALKRTRDRTNKRQELRALAAVETEFPAEGPDEVQAAIQRRRDDVIREAFVDELRPVLREAIDEDVIRAIKGMVGLAPAAILALKQDLESGDAVLRSKAASLIIKYTMGNNLVTPTREGSQGGLTIINQLPDAPQAAVLETGQTEDVIDAEVDEDDDARRCESCRLPRPASDFVGDAPICNHCLADRRARAFDAILSKDALRQSETAEIIQRQGGVGQPEVHQAGPGLQPGDLRTPGVVPERPANPAGFEGGGDPAGTQAVRGAPFSGPPDPKRYSNGSD